MIFFCNPKVACAAALITVLLAIPPSLISAVGVVVALFSLLLAAVAALLGRVVCALAVGLLATLNIFGFSIATAFHDFYTGQSIVMVGGAYLIYLLAIARRLWQIL